MNARKIEIQLKKDVFKKKDGTEAPIYTGEVFHNGELLKKVKGFVKDGSADKKTGLPTKYFYLNEDVKDGETLGSFTIKKYTGVSNNKAWKFYKCSCYDFKINGLYFPVTTDRMFESVELEFMTFQVDDWAVDNLTDKGYNLGDEESILDSEMPF